MFGCLGLDCLEGLGLGLGPNELPSDNWWKEDAWDMGPYKRRQQVKFWTIWKKKVGFETHTDPKTGELLVPSVVYGHGVAGPSVQWTRYPKGTDPKGFQRREGGWGDDWGPSPWNRECDKGGLECRATPNPRYAEWRNPKPMTPEQLEKAKDVLTKGFDQTRQLYQRMIDEGKSYHGMTPKQLKKYIDGLDKKLAEQIKALEDRPYMPMYGITGNRAISPNFGSAAGGRVTDAASLDFGIDKKSKQEPPRSWDPYKPTPTPPELAPSEKPTIETGDLHMEMPKVTPKPGCGTICTQAVGHNSCVNTCTGERYKTDGQDRKITPSPEQRLPSPPPRQPAITMIPTAAPAVVGRAKATTGRTAMSGLGCVGLGCMGEMTSDQRTKALSMLVTLRNYLARLEAYQARGFDVENSRLTVKMSIMAIEGNIAAGTYEMAQVQYKAAVAAAEKDLARAQQAFPYSTPPVSAPAPTPSAAVESLAQTPQFNQNLVANKVGASALSNAKSVFQQSSSVQAAITPFTQSIMDTWFPTPAALQPGPDALTKVGELLAAKRISDQAAAQAAAQAAKKKTNSLLLVGAAVVGLGVLYFAFKSKD